MRVQGSLVLRVLKGGSFNFPAITSKWIDLFGASPDSREDIAGFRLVVRRVK
jgi:hypothetical protein